VMVAGFPSAIAASLLPDAAAGVVMLPCRLGVRWIAGVAHVVGRVAPPAGVNVALWLAVLDGLTAKVVTGWWRARPPVLASGDPAE
jgi:hypothetical protein